MKCVASYRSYTCKITNILMKLKGADIATTQKRYDDDIYNH